MFFTVSPAHLEFVLTNRTDYKYIIYWREKFHFRKHTSDYSHPQTTENATKRVNYLDSQSTE